MKPAVWLSAAALALVLGVAAWYALRDDVLGAAESGGRPRVVATTSLLADAARVIGGDSFEVAGLMGPGVDPHLYKASAGDVELLRRADLVLYNGLHLEGKMGEVFEGLRAQGRRTVAVAERIPAARLLPIGDGMHDPHLWFDVALWAEALQAVAGAMAKTAPAAATEIGARAVAYFGELAALDDEVRRAMAAIPAERRVLVTAHDAFGYFGRAYAVEVTGLLGVSTVAEAGTDDVQRLAAMIAERRLPAIFVETTVPVRYVEALRDAVLARGHEVRIGGHLYSDALGDADGPAGSYVGMVRENAQTIAAALTQGAEAQP